MAEPSSRFSLFRAVQPSRCCFCPQAISQGAEVWRAGQQMRFAHVECAQRVLIGVLERRDASGKSEDLHQEANL